MCKFHCKSILGPSVKWVAKEGVFATHLEQTWNTSLPFTFQTDLQRILVGKDKTFVETVPILEKLKNPQSIAKVLQKCSYTVGTNPYIL